MEAPPRQVGKYEVLGLVGQGAIGVVYKACDPFMNRTVALKKFAGPNLLGGEQGDVLKTRFLQEAKAAGRLKHPNIVTIYDVDVDPADGLPFMAMEYADGGSLAAWMRTHGVMAPGPAVDLIRQVALGLAYGHDHGVVHRDVKPDNILLDAEDRPLVADFGCADVQDPDLTVAAFATLGTPFYMSPEQVKAETVDGRSDLFSLGVVFYLLVTGERPFRGDSVPSVCYSIVHSPYERLPVDLPHSDVLGPIMAKLLAKRAEDRFESGHELIAALEALRPSMGLPSEEPSASRTGTAAGTLAHSAEGTSPPTHASASRAPGLSVPRRMARAARSLLSGLTTAVQTLVGVALFCFILVLVLNPAILTSNSLWPERLERSWKTAKAKVEARLSSWKAGWASERAAEPDAPSRNGVTGARPAAGPGGARGPAYPEDLSKSAQAAVVLARQGHYQAACLKLDDAEAGLAALTAVVGKTSRRDMDAAKEAVSDARLQVGKALAAWAGPILDASASALAKEGRDGEGSSEAVVQAYASAYPVLRLAARLPPDVARKALALRTACRERLGEADWSRAQELGETRATP